MRTLGAFDSGERSRALDLPGFDSQLVFSTFAASDYVHRQLFGAPVVREDVGWLIEQCGDDIFLFSSDFPHPEGSKDPIRLFEETMGDVSDRARDRFYEHNFAEMMRGA